MHRKILVSLFAASALAACAHQPIVEANAGMAWSLRQPEGETALRFGTPRGDATLLSLSCEPHSGEVDITLHAPPARMSLVALASDGQRTRYIMEAGLGPADEPILSGSTKASDPVLRRFAETGDLMVFASGHGQMLPMEQDKAAKFLAACRR